MTANVLIWRLSVIWEGAKFTKSGLVVVNFMCELGRIMEWVPRTVGRFGTRLTLEWVHWAEQIALPDVGSLHLSGDSWTEQTCWHSCGSGGASCWLPSGWNTDLSCPWTRSTSTCWAWGLSPNLPNAVLEIFHPPYFMSQYLVMNTFITSSWRCFSWESWLMQAFWNLPTNPRSLG